MAARAAEERGKIPAMVPLLAVGGALFWYFFIRKPPAEAAPTYMVAPGAAVPTGIPAAPAAVPGAQIPRAVAEGVGAILTTIGGGPPYEAGVTGPPPGMYGAEPVTEIVRTAEVAAPGPFGVYLPTVKLGPFGVPITTQEVIAAAPAPTVTTAPPTGGPGVFGVSLPSATPTGAFGASGSAELALIEQWASGEA